MVKGACAHIPTAALSLLSKRSSTSSARCRAWLNDFVESVNQGGSWFDVYGVYRDRLSWFVKVGETEDGLLVMSHHEPERGPLRTISGAMIDVTERTPLAP